MLNSKDATIVVATYKKISNTNMFYPYLTDHVKETFHAAAFFNAQVYNFLYDCFVSKVGEDMREIGINTLPTNQSEI